MERPHPPFQTLWREGPSSVSLLGIAGNSQRRIATVPRGLQLGSSHFKMPVPCVSSFPIILQAGRFLRWKGGEEVEMDTLAFLFVGFKKKYRYWESVNLVRKLLMISIMTFVPTSFLKVWRGDWDVWCG